MKVHSTRYDQYGRLREETLVRKVKGFKIKNWLRNFGMFKSKNLYYFDYSEIKVNDKIISGHLYGKGEWKNGTYTPHPNPVPLINLPDDFTVSYHNWKKSKSSEDYEEWSKKNFPTPEDYFKELKDYCREVLFCDLDIVGQTKKNYDGNRHYTEITVKPNQGLVRENRLSKLIDK